MELKSPPFSEIIAGAQRSAIHLEMRDSYTPSDSAFLAWQASRSISEEDKNADQEWFDLVRSHTARGVEFRRARIVSEPITGYIRFEYETTSELNVAAGEQVRWLPRRQASDLRLPGNDFWVFDERLVLFHHFSGDGEVLDHELSDDPGAIKLCVSAFEAVWVRAIDHQDYRPA